MGTRVFFFNALLNKQTSICLSATRSLHNVCERARTRRLCLHNGACPRAMDGDPALFISLPACAANAPRPGPAGHMAAASVASANYKAFISYSRHLSSVANLVAVLKRHLARPPTRTHTLLAPALFLIWQPAVAEHLNPSSPPASGFCEPVIWEGKRDKHVLERQRDMLGICQPGGAACFCHYCRRLLCVFQHTNLRSLLFKAILLCQCVCMSVIMFESKL